MLEVRRKSQLRLRSSIKRKESMCTEGKINLRSRLNKMMAKLSNISQIMQMMRDAIQLIKKMKMNNNMTQTKKIPMIF